ncbi:hypothetical protein ACFSR7_06220 [Cohnella sp. GCM10020058]|uniref:hypothetical protein n=1 Tax=Cohnella sp. GCM10020058 TaxID=3317330 RepID=UPI0036278C35
MAYRTYKEVFRVRAEVSSLGAGNKRVVLPEWATITMDVVIMFFLLLPIGSLIIAPIPNLFISAFLNIHHPFMIWIEGAIMAGAAAIFLHKKEAAGKTPLQFIGTIMGFVIRSAVNSWHDGWETRKIELQTHKEMQIYVRRYDDRACGSLPARGYNISRFRLHSATAVAVRKNYIEFSKSGKRLEPGYYEVNGKVIVPVTEPIRRAAPSLREED